MITDQVHFCTVIVFIAIIETITFWYFIYQFIGMVPNNIRPILVRLGQYIEITID